VFIFSRKTIAESLKHFLQHKSLQGSGGEAIFNRFLVNYKSPHPMAVSYLGFCTVDGATRSRVPTLQLLLS
jgi:hypothetical protein